MFGVVEPKLMPPAGCFLALSMQKKLKLNDESLVHTSMNELPAKTNDN